jgi:hypothetical protein
LTCYEHATSGCHWYLFHKKRKSWDSATCSRVELCVTSWRNPCSHFDAALQFLIGWG